MIWRTPINRSITVWMLCNGSFWLWKHYAIENAIIRSKVRPVWTKIISLGSFHHSCSCYRDRQLWLTFIVYNSWRIMYHLVIAIYVKRKCSICCFDIWYEEASWHVMHCLYITPWALVFVANLCYRGCGDASAKWMGLAAWFDSNAIYIILTYTCYQIEIDVAPFRIWKVQSKTTFWRPFAITV